VVTDEGRYLWSIEDHVCRCCFGRVLMRETFDRKRVYRCSNCGVEREGLQPSAICACGIKLKTNVDAGVRCKTSTTRTPEFPSEIVAAQAELISNLVVSSKKAK
jgi:hypothetical protein